MTQDESPDDEETTLESADWQLWPPAPKVQIILIAAAFGLFNLMLIVIWAVVMMAQSS